MLPMGDRSHLSSPGSRSGECKSAKTHRFLRCSLLYIPLRNLLTRVLADANALDALDPVSKKDFARYQKMYPEIFNNPKDFDGLGAAIVAVSVKHHELTAEEMSRVSCSSAQMLMTKGSSSMTDTTDNLPTVIQTLRDGFAQSYIDPFGYVEKTYDRLVQNMDEYRRRGNGIYIAPYTSLVASSMMGKSRLMKELTKKGPLVYVCFREISSFGYPPATPGLLDWFEAGSCGSLGNIALDRPDVLSDKDFFIPVLKHSLFFLHLLHQLDLLISNKSLHDELNLKVHRDDNYEWMWDFFADPRYAFVEARETFWRAVQSNTDTHYRELREKSTPRRCPVSQPGSPKIWLKYDPKITWASDYLQYHYGQELATTRKHLMDTIARDCSTSTKEPLLIVCFDEARHLCNTSAVTNATIKTGGRIGNEVEVASMSILYSNFQAMRRALRYLQLANPVPSIFGLFTDTTSPPTIFQPRLSADPTSRQIAKFPRAGRKQFEPIYVFTSIDAHARILNNYYTISDHKEVAKVERLLKFGRAGWYSLYSGKSSSNVKTYNILRLAISKLLGGDESISPIQDLSEQLPPNSSGPLTQKNLLCLFAILAVRLSLTVGPFSTEAAEVVSNHLAIVLKTDHDRDFLRTYYPSEPILAEASAQCTSSIGWSYPLKALYHHLQDGIVDVGYREELLSKILCLMAMDETPKPFPEEPVYDTLPYFQHTQPVKVRDFLNKWLVAPSGKGQFTDALYQTNIRTNNDELERFLNGYVFFNHFVRLERIVSMEAIVCAWNRGAAIMPMEIAHSFDHVIPVMLAAKNGTPTFGPMFEKWSPQDVKKACHNVSFILINSRSYANAAGHNTAADGCVPKKTNFSDFSHFAGNDVTRASDTGTPSTVYLSIVQDFGPRQAKEPYVNIRPRGIDKNLQQSIQPSLIYRQIVVILKELGPNTYRCLQGPDFVPTQMDILQLPNEPHETPDYGEELPEEGYENLGSDKWAEATKYLRMLKAWRLNYMEDVNKEAAPGVRNFLPLVYAGDSDTEGEACWAKARAG